ncbi:MAG: AEC family transporter [Thermoleophilia bacterium]
MTETALGALLIILVGAAARHFGLIRREQGDLFVRVVIYLALPPLVFLIIVRADLDPSLLLVPVAAFVIHGVLLALSWVSTRLWGMERPRAGAMIVATSVGNTGFFGLPLIAASGSGFSQPAAVMYDALATAVITWTSTVAISNHYGRADGEARVRLADVGRALLLPPTLALAAGLVVNLAGVNDLPALVEQPFEIMAGAVLPLTMLYGGLMLEVRGLARIWREMAYVVVVRLGVATLIGLGVARLFGFTGDVLNTVVIMAAMPTAMMSLVLGARAGLRSDVLAGAVAVTTVLCTITLPLWRAVLL